MINQDSELQAREKQRSAMVACSYECHTKADYEEALKEYYPDLNREEMLLAGICDWDRFNEKMQDPKYMFPTQFLQDKIKIDEWKNIPIPLMETTECFELGFINVSNVLNEVIYEQKARTCFVASRLKDMARQN